MVFERKPGTRKKKKKRTFYKVLLHCNRVEIMLAVVEKQFPVVLDPVRTAT
jgi:hypothetical protein